MIDLKKLVQDASQCLEASGDKKAWVNENEMHALIAAGAEVIMNRKQIDDGSHVTEVIFKNICFIHSSRHPLIPSIPINSKIH